MNETIGSLGKTYELAPQMPFPSLYFLLSAIFFIFGWLWIFILRRNKKNLGSGAASLHHCLLLAMVFLKSLLLFFHSLNFYYLYSNGSYVGGMSLLYTAHLLKFALLVVVTLLVGSAVGMFSPVLLRTERTLLISVFTVQVLSNFVSIFASIKGADINTHGIVFSLVDIASSVIVATVALRTRRSTGKGLASDSYMVRMFCFLCVTSASYLFVSSAVQKLLPQIFSVFQHHWIDEMVQETVTLVFLVLIAWKYRPERLIPYVALHRNTESLRNADTLCYF